MPKLKTKHTATDSKGQVHTRTSLNKVYSFVVVIHFKYRPANPPYREVPAHSKAEWSARKELAQRNADRWRVLGHVDGVELIPAQREAV